MVVLLNLDRATNPCNCMSDFVYQMPWMSVRQDIRWRLIHDISALVERESGVISYDLHHASLVMSSINQDHVIQLFRDQGALQGGLELWSSLKSI